MNHMADDVYQNSRNLILLTVGMMVRSGRLPRGLSLDKITAEPCRDPSRGEISSNAALIIAAQTKEDPMILAAEISETMKHIHAVLAEIAQEQS